MFSTHMDKMLKPKRKLLRSPKLLNDQNPHTEKGILYHLHLFVFKLFLLGAYCNADARRMNVALTRPKLSLWVLCNTQTLERDIGVLL